MNRQRRRLGTFAALALALVPLAVAATAFACARLATLKLDREAGKPGKTVEVTGRNFNSSPTASTVKVRWNSRNGDVLWEGRPDANGKFTGSFDIPQTDRGYYVVLATQTVASGAPAAGTPGRSSLKVRRAREAQVAAVAPVPGTPGGGPSAPVVMALTAALLALVGGGAWLTATARRRRSLPVLGRTA